MSRSNQFRSSSSIFSCSSSPSSQGQALAPASPTLPPYPQVSNSTTTYVIQVLELLRFSVELSYQTRVFAILLVVFHKHLTCLLVKGTLGERHN